MCMWANSLLWTLKMTGERATRRRPIEAAVACSSRICSESNGLIGGFFVFAVLVSVTGVERILQSLHACAMTNYL
jgi:hypothetical protein